MEVKAIDRTAMAQFSKKVLGAMKSGRNTAETVSRHMAHGDIVSPQDEKKLMEHDAMMYLSSKISQQMKPHHRDISDRSLVKESEARQDGREEKRVRPDREPVYESGWDEEEELEEAGVIAVGARIDVKG